MKITRPGTPPYTHDHRRWFEILRRHSRFTKSVIFCEITHAAVMHMHMPARADIHRGEADDLPIPADRIAARDRPNRNSMAGGNPLRRPGARGNFHVFQKRGAGNDDIVVPMQRNDDGRGRMEILLRMTTQPSLT